MSWVRLDDQFAHHPKVLRAGPTASFLWIACIAYCQKFLTDGFVPCRAIATLADVPDHPAQVELLLFVGLLEQVDQGFQVHDYLEFNESAESVKRRREQDRQRKESSRNPAGIQQESSRTPTRARAPAPHPILKKNLDPLISMNNLERENPSYSGNGNGNGKSASLSPAAPVVRMDGTGTSEVTERAGRFIERYEVLYREHRKGARYTVNPVRDFAAACTLCTTWDNDERLDKLAVIFLNSDHKFAEEGSRTIPQFRALASWCDGLLAEHESQVKS